MKRDSPSRDAVLLGREKRAQAECSLDFCWVDFKQSKGKAVEENWCRHLGWKINEKDWEVQRVQWRL